MPGGILPCVRAVGLIPASCPYHRRDAGHPGISEPVFIYSSSLGGVDRPFPVCSVSRSHACQAWDLPRRPWSV